DLGTAPNDLVLQDTEVFLLADDAVYPVGLEDIASPTLLLSGIDGTGDSIEAGGYFFTASSSGGITAYRLVKDESDLEPFASIPASAAGCSRVATSKNRLLFADTVDTGHAQLHCLDLQGFRCHHIDAGEIYTYGLDAEIVRARDLVLKDYASG